jgi:acylphosphatase
VSGERVARRAVVHGRVQGVWFRESTRRRAEADGVAGWVRNREDGAVEAWLEGAPEDVEALLGFLRLGPPAAEVERVEVRDAEPEGLEGFSVR